MPNDFPTPNLRKNAASDGVETLRRLVLDGLSPLTKDCGVRIFYEKFGVSAKVEIDEKKSQAFVTFSAAEAYKVARATDAIYAHGGFLRLSFPDWSKRANSSATKTSRQMILDGLPPRTSANDVRSLFGKFGVSTKVEVDERLHQALATFSSPKAFKKVASSATLRLRGVDICIFILGNQKFSNEVVSDSSEIGHQLLLDGLPPRTTENDVRSILGRCGASIKVEVDEQIHRAIITMYTADAFRKVMASAPFYIKGVQLFVAFSEPD